MDGDLLTDDEKLLHGKRWQRETVSFSQAVRMWAKRYCLDNDLNIDEGENWQEAIEELMQNLIMK